MPQEWADALTVVQIQATHSKHCTRVFGHTQGAASWPSTPPAASWAQTQLHPSACSSQDIRSQHPAEDLVQGPMQLTCRPGATTMSLRRQAALQHPQ